MFTKEELEQNQKDREKAAKNLVKHYQHITDEIKKNQAFNKKLLELGVLASVKGKLDEI